MSAEETKTKKAVRPLYRGIKEVYADPMTRAEYNKYRGWELPKDEEGSDEGYLVEYTNGGKPNHPDHKGYISWSPKKVFDDAYVLLEEENFYTRLVSEEKDLRVRLASLESFLVSGKDKKLGVAQSNLLYNQKNAMANYHYSLVERLKLLTKYEA